jgi:Rrf2 family cysteine metabolism transcriptional repressor
VGTQRTPQHKTGTPSRTHPLTSRPSFHGTGAVSFSTKGEYGVRLMVQLGRHYGLGPASLAEIAQEEDLPRAYLEQLVMSLRDAGLVHSTRGAHGGYELVRAPADIRMSDILRALEGPIAPMVCASEDPEHATICDRTARCTVNVLWVRIRDAITGTLEGMTLADLVPTTLSLPVQLDGVVARASTHPEPVVV